MAESQRQIGSDPPLSDCMKGRSPTSAAGKLGYGSPYQMKILWEFDDLIHLRSTQARVWHIVGVQ